jgi:hypothetical protein
VTLGGSPGDRLGWSNTLLRPCLFDEGVKIMFFQQILIIESALVLSLFIAWLILRKKNKRFAALITLLAFIYGAFTIIQIFLRGLEIDSYYLGWPLSLLKDSASTTVAILLAFRFFSFYIFSGFNPESLPEYSAPAVLSDSVSKILDSEHFLTALRSTLPKGKEDERFGFDFIPFMLDSIDQRRKRAVKSARFFLLITTCSALLFSGVVMYFGYILVNEASAGMARSLIDIKTSMDATSESLRYLTPSYYTNTKFQQDVAPSLERLEQLESGDKNKQVQDKITAAILEAKNTGNFASLSVVLAQAESQASKEGFQDKNYSSALADANSNMAKFMNAQSVVLPGLSSRVEELKQLIPKAEDTLSKPENRVPEIIKRLTLGLVIATFFLALLRYMGGLYRTRYQQVLAAESDDFMVRRFYVAFKSSVPSDEQRKTVLSSFMTMPGYTNKGDAQGSLDDTAKQEYEILKELLGALSKKL